MDGMDLLRLYYCSRSTLLGMADCGFPATMKRLEMGGYVEKSGNGYKATQQTFTMLRDTKVIERLRTI